MILASILSLLLAVVSPSQFPTYPPAIGAYMLAENSGETYTDIKQTATTRTILSAGLVVNMPSIPHRATFVLSDSLADLGVKSSARAATIVYYDIEHWAQTPLSEQNNPEQAISKGSIIVHDSHVQYGVASDGKFLGIDGATCSVDISKGIVPKVNWAQVDYVNLQAQELAGPNCHGGYFSFTGFVKEAAREIRAKNPSIVITAQVSLRDTNPELALAAARSVHDYVQAVYVAYPAPCQNCTPQDLYAVISKL